MNPDDQTNTVPSVPADDNGQVSDTPVSQPQVPVQDVPAVPAEESPVVSGDEAPAPAAPVVGDAGEAAPGAVSGGEENQGEEQGGVDA